MPELKLESDRESSKSELNLKKYKKPSSNFMDKEITFNLKVNPRNALKFSSIIVLLLFVFYLGRWTASPEIVSPVSAPLPTETLPEESSFDFSGLFSSITGLFSFDDDSSEEAPEEAASAETAASNLSSNQSVEATGATTAETPEDTAAEPATEAASAETSEEVITSYSKVALVITKARINWRGTDDNKWGKITHLDYKIKNSEAGTIKPDYLIIAVEGYNEEAEKKNLPLPLSSREVKAGTTVSSAVAIPSGGFNYHEKTAGDLTSVEITVTLHDANAKLMASFKNTFDLSGSSS